MLHALDFPIFVRDTADDIDAPTMIAVTLLDRMLGDQIIVSPELLAKYADHAQTVAINYLKAELRL